MSSYREGQANQFLNALEGAGFTSANLTALGQNKKLLRDIKRVLAGESRIVPSKYIIDCDSAPFVPEGLKVESHKKMGQFEWDPKKVTLYVSQSQQCGCVDGHELRMGLNRDYVLNANVLDYLLDYPKLIPEEWKGKNVCFWGTIYRSSGGSLYVRCLCWGGHGWYWDRKWLDGGFLSTSPSACLR